MAKITKVVQHWAVHMKPHDDEFFVYYDNGNSRRYDCLTLPNTARKFMQNHPEQKRSYEYSLMWIYE